MSRHMTHMVFMFTLQPSWDPCEKHAPRPQRVSLSERVLSTASSLLGISGSIIYSTQQVADLRQPRVYLMRYSILFQLKLNLVLLIPNRLIQFNYILNFLPPQGSVKWIQLCFLYGPAVMTQGDSWSRHLFRICSFLRRGREGKLLTTDRRTYREPQYYEHISGLCTNQRGIFLSANLNLSIKTDWWQYAPICQTCSQNKLPPHRVNTGINLQQDPALTWI